MFPIQWNFSRSKGYWSLSSMILCTLNTYMLKYTRILNTSMQCLYKYYYELWTYLSLPPIDWKLNETCRNQNFVLGIFELFQHEKNGKFLERLQTFRKSLSICGRAGNQVFMWFVTFWGCPEPIFSTRGQIWCENETFAEINLLHKIASNSETVWSWEKFRTIPESCWDWLSTCTGCAVITSTIWLIQGVL